METKLSTSFAGNSNGNEGTIVYQTADVEKLIREKQQLIACAEELELEASRDHRVLTEELRMLKTANKELKGKYEFSESHYQMTLRHANNLQSFLDARDQELDRLRGQIQELQGQLNTRNDELARLRSQIQELQGQLNTCNDELVRARSHGEELQITHSAQMAELFQVREQLENANKLLEQREDELMQTHRHANNLQSILDAQTEALKKSKLSRIKERIRGWFR